MPKSQIRENNGASNSHYDFSQPYARFYLPPALKEISALTYLDENHVGAVQDEDGIFFVVSLDSGLIKSKIAFGPPGDYEGVEMLDGRLYVLLSDATLLEYAYKDGALVKVLGIETGLGAKACNAEGLGSDGRRLLLVCKNENARGRNEVYEFIPKKDKPSLRLAFELDGAKLPGKKSLRPSALAFHPVTGHMVVLSSSRQLLMSFDKTGELVDSWDLSAAHLEQPEGLAFMPNGDVVIASEGNIKPAKLVRFKWKG